MPKKPSAAVVKNLEWSVTQSEDSAEAKKLELQLLKVRLQRETIQLEREKLALRRERSGKALR